MASRKEGRTVRPLPVGFIDGDPRKARFHRDVAERVSDYAYKVMDIEVPAVANTEFAVLHPSLDRQVTEFEILMQDGPGRLYRSSPHLWTRRVSYFKYDQNGPRRIRIRVR